VVRESVTQILTKLLATMPACTTSEFEKAAVAKGAATRDQARQFLENGIACGTIQRERGSHNRKFHSLVSPPRGVVQ